MPDRAPPSDVPPPVGAPRSAAFSGLMEGPRGDDGALRSAVARIRALDLTRVDLSVDGGRFSVLFEGGHVPGEKLHEAAQEALVEALRSAVASSAEPGAIESSLRCRAVYDEGVVDTLFAVSGGGLSPVSRLRSLADLDPDERAALADPAPPPPLPFAARQLAWLLPLAAVAVVLLAWQSGLVDRALAPDAGELEQSLGPFDGLLAMDVELDLGNYVVTITRGDAYPETADAVAEALAGATSAADRAAVNVVADGGVLFVRLVDDEGEAILARGLALRALLTEADGEAQARLPGRIGARTLDLALDDGRPTR